MGMTQIYIFLMTLQLVIGLSRVTDMKVVVNL